MIALRYSKPLQIVLLACKDHMLMTYFIQELLYFSESSIYLPDLAFRLNLPRPHLLILQGYVSIVIKILVIPPTSAIRLV